VWVVKYVKSSKVLSDFLTVFLTVVSLIKTRLAVVFTKSTAPITTATKINISMFVKTRGDSR